MRDDFPAQAKEVLAKRVGYRCSNPTCRQLTSGPHDDPARAVNVGVTESPLSHSARLTGGRELRAPEPASAVIALGKCLYELASGAPQIADLRVEPLEHRLESPAFGLTRGSPAGGSVKGADDLFQCEA